MRHSIEMSNLYRPLGEHISVEAALDARGRKKENVWIGQLTKIGTRAVLDGDLRFVFALAELESNPQIEYYQFDRDKIKAHLSKERVAEDDAAEVDFIAQFRNGAEQWWRVAETRPAKFTGHDVNLMGAARECGATFLVRTLKDISPWEIRFHNWLDLSQAMVSTHFFDCSEQICAVDALLHAHRCMTYGQLQQAVSGDPSLVRGAIARLIQLGRAQADLDSSLLWPGTMIHCPPVDSGTASEREESIFAMSREETPPPSDTRKMDTPGHDHDSVTRTECTVRKGRPRSLICPSNPLPQYWPPLDISSVPGQDRVIVSKRKHAVELYAKNAAPEIIEQTSGLPVAEARRLYQRCTATDDQGRLYGYNGLLRYNHLKPYTRRRVVVHNLLDGSNGCAGAMRQLFRHMPESESFIRQQVFPEDSEVTTCDPAKNMHEAWLDELRRLGVSEPQWPFCSKSKGRQSYYRHVKKLRQEMQGKAKGKSNYRSLVRALRPLTFMQLDYKKTDCGTILMVENNIGEQRCVPIRRWYKGFICCEASTAVVGISTLFEIEPSCDCALETVLSALDPSTDISDPGSEVAKGPFLPRHFLPQLAWNGWLVLRVDNGLANRALDFIHNTIDTVGCWIQFGPSYYWPARHQIERILGIINRAGEIRMPSSYGSDPNDSRRKNPEGAAIKNRILASEVLRVTEDATGRVNTDGSEANAGTSRLNTIRLALAHADVGTYLRPLPLATQRDHHLLGHYERRMVHRDHRGKLYVKIDRCSYKSGRLSGRPDLVNKWIGVFVGRRDATRARGFVEGTGEDLGTLEGSGGYCTGAIPWALRKLIERSVAEGEEARSVDGVEQWKQERMKNVMKGKRGKARARSDGNRLASAVQRQNLNASPANEAFIDTRDRVTGGDSTPASFGVTCQPTAADDSSDGSDPFGINRIPTLGGQDAK